jgi:molecular chaperone HtpG
MISIPQRLDDILERDKDLSASFKKTVSVFNSEVFENPLYLFPEYTEHGSRHVTAVLETAAQLMTEDSLRILTPEDSGALILSTVLHDCAMHLTNDGFRRLVSGQTSLTPNEELGDRAWGELWDAYLAEAARFSPADNVRMFGDAEPVKPPPIDDWDWGEKQKLMAGEFLRRHHASLAHQIALSGFPDASSENTRLDPGISRRRADVIGLIARSHGMSLRPCLDYLEKTQDNKVNPRGICALFIMVLLRIADYLQVEAGRAPKARIRMQAIRSGLSIREWKKHHAVPELAFHKDDPEAWVANVVEEEIDSISIYLSLRYLMRDIQRQLDESWAILGEVYGRLKEPNFPLYLLGMTFRRLRTNLEEPTFLKKLKFQPEPVRFRAADPQVFELLIEPLYGGNTDAGVRELVQNSVDAVRELEAYCRRHNQDIARLPRPEQRADVVVKLEETKGSLTLVVQDRGIGMTLEIVRDYFLRVGASYRTSSAWQAEFAGPDQKSNILRTGYFGVGALAAFLVGDEMRVVTRHVTSAEGLGFTASLRTDSIQIDRVPGGNCPIGTRIEIPLRHELQASWSPHFRYYLADPTVEVTGRLPESTYPDDSSQPLPEWRRLEEPAAPIVFWHRGGGYVERVVHNGFMIEHGDQALRTLWQDMWYGLRILLPPLHILDREGNRPKPYLNLARTEFLQGRFPSLDHIFVDVLKDYLAFLLVAVPDEIEKIKEVGGELYRDGEGRPYRYVDCAIPNKTLAFDRNNQRCQPIVYTRDGVVPLDAGVLESIGVRSLFLLDGFAPKEILEFDASYGVVPLIPVANDASEMLYPKEGFAVTPFGLNIIGSVCYLTGRASSSGHEYWLLDVEDQDHRGAPVPLSGNAVRLFYTPLPSSDRGLAIYWSLGHPDRKPEPTVKDVLFRAFSGRSSGDPVESPLVTAWRAVLGDFVIPYDVTKREARFTDAFTKLAPYVAAWRHLRITQ